MPQVDTFLADEDLYRLADFFFSAGCRIVPDLAYEAPRYLEVKNLIEFDRLRESSKQGLFFVLSDDWQKYPLELVRIEREEGIRYFIGQKSGGPSIDIFAPPPHNEGGERVLAHGLLGADGQNNSSMKTAQRS